MSAGGSPDEPVPAPRAPGGGDGRAPASRAPDADPQRAPAVRRAGADRERGPALRASDADPERVPALRASDAERERAVTTLRDGAAHGRLTFEELAQRTELAYAATTAAELERLLADLPQAVPEAAVVGGERKQRRWNIAILGGCERKGRWRPAPDSVALAVLGGVDLDLRDATIDGDEIVITAISILGGVEIVVPEGVEVDLGGFALLGGTEHKPGTAAIRPGTPVVRVRAFTLLGGIEVKVKGAAGERRRLRHG